MLINKTQEQILKIAEIDLRENFFLKYNVASLKVCFAHMVVNKYDFERNI